MKKGMIFVFVLVVLAFALPSVSAVLCGNQTYPDGTGYCCDPLNGDNGVWFRGDYYDECPLGDYYYVQDNVSNPSCSDTGPGDFSQPWCTINSLNSMTGGNVAIILGGEYNENNGVYVFILSSGSLSSYTIVKGHPDYSRPIISSRDVGGAHIDGGVYMNPPGIIYSWTILDYLEITNVSAGIRMYGSNSIVQDTLIHDNVGRDGGDHNPSGIGVYYDPKSNIIIRDNVVYNTMTEGDSWVQGTGWVYDGIFDPYICHPNCAAVMFYRTRGGLVENNTLFNSSVGVFLKNGNSNFIIRKNRLFQNSQGIRIQPGCSDGQTQTLADNHTIYENLIYNSGAGFSIRAYLTGFESLPGGCYQPDNVSFFNNLIYDTFSSGISITPGNIGDMGSADNFYSRNNLVYNIPGGSFGGENLLMLHRQGINNMTSDNNILYDDFETNIASVCDDYDSPNGRCDAFGQGPYGLYFDLLGHQIENNMDWNSIQEDPQFISTDPSNESFLVPSLGSPAIDNGTIVPGYHCSDAGDNDTGCKEWYGSAPDIGAYEYNPLAGAPTCEAESYGGRCWYVDNQNLCNDLWDGNFTHPFCTIEAANNRHNGGDHVYILPGEYRERIFPKSGIDENQRTVYAGYGNRSQILIMGSEIVSGWADEGGGIYSTNYVSTLSRCSIIRPDCFEDRKLWYVPVDTLPELEEPGEMFYDDGNDILYVLAYDTNDPNLNNHLIECTKDTVTGWTEYDTRPPGYTSPSYIRLEGLTLTQSGWHGISMDGLSQYVDIINNEISFTSGTGVPCNANPAAIKKMKDSWYCNPNSCEDSENVCHKPQINVIGNTIHDLGSHLGPAIEVAYMGGIDHFGEGIKFYDVKDSVIDNNTFYNLHIAVHIKEKNSYINITNNRIFNFTNGGIGFQDHGSNMLIEGNLIYDQVDKPFGSSGIAWLGTWGCQHGSSVYPGHNDNMTILHNVISNVDTGIVMLNYEDRSGLPPPWSVGHNIRNNIFSEHDGVITGTRFDEPEHYVSDNNTFHHSSKQPEFSSASGRLTLPEWQVFSVNPLSPLGTELSPLLLDVGDPLFQDAANGDFNLVDGSAAIDAAEHIPGYHCTTSGGTTPTGCRVWYGLAPDMGAIEYNPGAPVITCNDADVNSDGRINIFDLAIVLFHIGTGDGNADIDNSGNVGSGDINEVRNRFGDVC